mgnify:CR=1 FL=1
MERPHWEYYLTLVDDIDRISRYVEITKDNYGVYSIELVRVLLAAGSEVDVVAKLLCRSVAPSESTENINDYRTVLLGAYPKLPDIKVAMPRHGIELGRPGRAGAQAPILTGGEATTESSTGGTHATPKRAS